MTQLINQSGYEPLNLENVSFYVTILMPPTWGFNPKVKLKLIKAHWHC